MCVSAWGAGDGGTWRRLPTWRPPAHTVAPVVRCHCATAPCALCLCWLSSAALLGWLPCRSKSSGRLAGSLVWRRAGQPELHAVAAVVFSLFFMGDCEGDRSAQEGAATQPAAYVRVKWRLAWFCFFVCFWRGTSAPFGISMTYLGNWKIAVLASVTLADRDRTEIYTPVTTVMVQERTPVVFPSVGGTS